MKQLLFGCSYYDLWVSPANWKTTTAKSALEKNWYVQYYFFDPAFKDKYPKGKPVRKKLNKLKTLEERKAAAEFFLEEIPRALEELNFNPITKQFMIPDAVQELVNPDDKLHPDMACSKAIELVWIKLRDEAIENLPEEERINAKPFDDVRIAKNRFIKGLQDMNYNDTPIKDLKLSQIKETIVHLKITDGYYNKFLSYNSKIFTELIEYGCIENNPFKQFKKKKPLQKIREVLTDAEFEDIMYFLHTNKYNFFRYGMIFHLSGARTTELFRLKAKDVSIDDQEYKVIIKKGGRHFEEIKVIIPDAMPFWREILNECEDPEHYLFSIDFAPGPDAIAARQVSRKWNKYVKKRYNEGKEIPVTADFYTAKHLFLDKLDAMQHQRKIEHQHAAQTMASHKTSKVTNANYLTNKKKRDRDSLKRIVLNVSTQSSLTL